MVWQHKTARSPQDRQGARDFYRPLGYRTANRQHLDPARAPGRERRFVVGIDIAGNGEVIAIAALGEVEHDRPAAGLHHRRQFAQMLGPAGGDRVGKFGQAGRALPAASGPQSSGVRRSVTLLTST